MKEIIKLIENNPNIAANLPSFLWLVSPYNRSEGRTTCLAIAFILNALMYPGVKIKYFDHSNRRNELWHITDIIKGLSLSQLLQVEDDSITGKLGCNIELPDNTNTKEMIAGMMKTIASLARSNGINFEELASMLNEAEVSHTIER